MATYQSHQPEHDRGSILYRQAMSLSSFLLRYAEAYRRHEVFQLSVECGTGQMFVVHRSGVSVPESIGQGRLLLLSSGRIRKRAELEAPGSRALRSMFPARDECLQGRIESLLYCFPLFARGSSRHFAFRLHRKYIGP